MPNVKLSEESPGAIDHHSVVKHGVCPRHKEICMAKCMYIFVQKPIPFLCGWNSR